MLLFQNNNNNNKKKKKKKKKKKDDDDNLINEKEKGDKMAPSYIDVIKLWGGKVEQAQL